MIPPPGSIERMELYRDRASRMEDLYEGLPDMPCVHYTIEERVAINMLIRRGHRDRIQDRQQYSSIVATVNNMCGKCPRTLDELVERSGQPEDLILEIIDSLPSIQRLGDGRFLYAK